MLRKAASPGNQFRRIIHARPHLPGISDWPITIIPEGEPATIGIPVILGRKGAFGSGEHETTVACLEELAKVAGIAGATVPRSRQRHRHPSPLPLPRQGCILRDSRIGEEYMTFIMEQAAG